MLKRSWLRYILAAALAATSILLRSAFRRFLGDDVPIVISPFAVLASAYLCGLGPGLLTTALCALGAAHYFMEPSGLGVAALEDRIRLAVFVLLGTSISFLTHALHRSRQAAEMDAAAKSSYNRRITHILASITDCYVSLDSEGRIVQLNDRAEQYLGIPRDELLGKLLEQRLPQVKGSFFEAQCRRAVNEQRTIQFECPSSVAPGRWAEVHAYPMPDGLCIYFRDITDRKQHERQLREAKEMAEAANRAKDRFLAALSHELRTPLTPVLMTASAMESDEALPERVRGELGMIRRQVELESRLIEDLLDLTRIARGKIQLQAGLADMHLLMQRALKTCEPDIAARQLNIQLDLRASGRMVWGDSARLEQVLWNLLKNSVKFTPAGGTIRISTRNAEPADALWKQPGFGVRANGAEQDPVRQLLIVEVSDSGVGIEPEVLPRIFNAFEQGGAEITRKYGGLGLGLAICKSILDVHGGRISACSDGRDRGATFRIELPAVSAPAKAERSAPGEESRRSKVESHQVRILLVEDHEQTSKVLARLLRSFEYDVKAASDCSTARGLADSNGFDLVISDIGLPDGDGLELMRYLKGRYNLTGIALSGFGMDEDIQRSREAGFVQHLTKPVNLGQLQCAIADALSQRGSGSGDEKADIFIR